MNYTCLRSGNEETPRIFMVLRGLTGWNTGRPDCELFISSS